jgi:hypothetical protein
MKLLVHLCRGHAPILCTADTNVAVDNLLEGLADSGVRAVRVGRPVKIREELRDLSLEALMQEHAANNKLDALRQELAGLSHGKTPEERYRTRVSCVVCVTLHACRESCVVCVACCELNFFGTSSGRRQSVRV